MYSLNKMKIVSHSEEFYLLGYNFSSPLKVNCRFGGTCSLHLQGRRISRVRRQDLLSTCFRSYVLLGLLESRWGGILDWPNPSSVTMALESTQPLTEMSTRNLLAEVWGSRRVRLTTSPPSASPLFRENVGASWAFTACYWDNFTFYLTLSSCIITQSLSK
jgi:hypothetical protein